MGNIRRAKNLSIIKIDEIEEIGNKCKINGDSYHLKMVAVPIYFMSPFICYSKKDVSSIVMVLDFCILGRPRGEAIIFLPNFSSN